MNQRYIDPNSSGGDGTTAALTGPHAAYVSCSAWENARQGVLTDIEQGIVNKNGPAKDTSALTIMGWTTTAAYYAELISGVAYRHTGKYDDTKAGIYSSSTNIMVMEEFVRIRHLICETKSSTTSAQCGIFIVNIASGGSAIYVENNIIKGHGNATYLQFGLYVGDSDATVYLSNNVIFNISAHHSASTGVFVSSCANAYIYNCTIDGNDCAYGYKVDGGTVALKNCIGTNTFTKDFYKSAGTVVGTNCSSQDDTSDDYGGSGNKINQTFTFVDAAHGDYHLASTDTGAIDFGLDLSADGSYPISTDIDGITRSGTWSIGADEYVPTIVGTGGAVYGGAAICNYTNNYAVIGTGGAVCSGAAICDYNYPTDLSIVGSGGVVCGGSAVAICTKIKRIVDIENLLKCIVFRRKLPS